MKQKRDLTQLLAIGWILGGAVCVIGAIVLRDRGVPYLLLGLAFVVAGLCFIIFNEPERDKSDNSHQSLDRLEKQK